MQSPTRFSPIPEIPGRKGGEHCVSAAPIPARIFLFKKHTSVCQAWAQKIRYGLYNLFSGKSEIESMLAGLEAFLHVLLLGDTKLRQVWVLGQAGSSLPGAQCRRRRHTHIHLNNRTEN